MRSTEWCRVQHIVLMCFAYNTGKYSTKKSTVIQIKVQNSAYRFFYSNIEYNKQLFKVHLSVMLSLLLMSGEYHKN